MELIPAIDMMGGKCVRLSQGRFDDATVFSDNPAEVARRWEGEGAQRLHLVDLNGSRMGAPQEIEAIKQIIAAVKIPVELGGGIRSLETAKKMLEIGVGRVIIGTSAALDSNLAKMIFRELGEEAVLGVDARNGLVAINGWEETTREKAVDFAQRIQKLGARRVIYTDISRDGMLAGANIVALKHMAESLKIPVIASGGISTLDDIRQLKSLANIGIEGAILGKALYTGDLILADALNV